MACAFPLLTNFSNFIANTYMIKCFLPFLSQRGWEWLYYSIARLMWCISNVSDTSFLYDNFTEFGVALFEIRVKMMVTMLPWYVGFYGIIETHERGRVVHCFQVGLQWRYGNFVQLKINSETHNNQSGTCHALVKWSLFVERRLKCNINASIFSSTQSARYE